MPFINSYDPFLTSSSPLLFYSLPFSYFWMSVFNFKGFFFCVSCTDSRSTKDELCECILTWISLSLNFLHFSFLYRLQQHWCALLVISAYDSFSCCIAFLFLLCPLVLQLWPLPCDLYDISDSAHLFLLYFLTVCNLSFCLVSRAFMRY